ncbi:hypothetical protein [Aneurinibacillus danicus]|uniref:Uncharacterized protein n=1 Tax=Aneurinibacillus danicus TaxID=267746 RepID=A0A511VDC5_9BACL|nr:hypothetical protein [Aneurinibacillus danicus]GEN35948.1 hypothetical protein ADA01nite_34080 [Aneurinibacillus danicus]
MDEQKLVEMMRSVIREELQPMREEIRKELQPLQKRLDSLEEGQKQIAKQIGDLTDKLLEKMDEQTRDAKSEVRQLANIQERQQSVIELLSIRSVEHDADIKRIKQLLMNQ